MLYHTQLRHAVFSEKLKKETVLSAKLNCKENKADKEKCNKYKSKENNVSKINSRRRKDSTAVMYLNNTVLYKTIFKYSIKMLLEKTKSPGAENWVVCTLTKV